MFSCGLRRDTCEKVVQPHVENSCPKDYKTKLLELSNTFSKMELQN